MAGIKALRNIRKLAAAGMSFMLLGAGSARAGQDEDFASAMIAYNRADFSTAMPLLRKTADAGHAQAQAVLASILDAADSDEEAVAYYRKSAAAGHLDGVFGLGTMLATGEGVKKNPAEARTLYIRAAEAGHKPAISALAQVYIRGELDVPEAERKSKDALKWISMAAEDGFLLALETLEAAYRSGDYGLTVDLAKAAQLKQKIDSMKGAKEKKGRRRGEKQ